MISQFTLDPATLEKLVQPKDKTPRQKLNNAVVRSAQTFRETTQPLHKRMAKHRRTSSSDEYSAVHLHFKEKGLSFKDDYVHILDREDRCFERGIKEAIHAT